MDLFLNPTAIIAILIALSIHEWAHGYVAYKLGDPTAEQEGRLTINPIAHLDLMGSLMFLIVGFGWAKPVPVDPRYFRNPKRDTTLVALAGPVSNLILAIVAFVALQFLMPRGIEDSAMGLLQQSTTGDIFMKFVEQLASYSLFINLALMAFNLLPIAPLDGSKILRLFIPLRYEDQYEQFMARGPIILLALILGGMFLNVPILSGWVYGIMNAVLRGMEAMASLVS